MKCASHSSCTGHPGNTFSEEATSHPNCCVLLALSLKPLCFLVCGEHISLRSIRTPWASPHGLLCFRDVFPSVAPAAGHISCLFGPLKAQPRLWWYTSLYFSGLWLCWSKTQGFPNLDVLIIFMFLFIFLNVSFDSPLGLVQISPEALFGDSRGDEKARLWSPFLTTECELVS